MTDGVNRHPDLLEEPLCEDLGPGKLGAVAARAGVGKSTCLVRIALSDLIRGRQVLHVALDRPALDVRAAYDAKLDALRAHTPKAVPSGVRFEVERRRVIHSYLGGSFSPVKLGSALSFLGEHMGFRPRTVILDGLSFDEGTKEQLVALGEVVGQVGASLWLSARTHREEPLDEKTGLPSALAPLVDQLEVILCLEPSGEEILLTLAKEGPRLERRRLPFKLDPATMLLARR